MSAPVRALARAKPDVPAASHAAKGTLLAGTRDVRSTAHGVSYSPDCPHSPATRAGLDIPGMQAHTVARVAEPASRQPWAAPALRTPSPLRVQAKLEVGEAGDACEQEADRVARLLASAPGEKVPQHAMSQAGPAPTPAAHEAPPVVHEVLRSPGEPLDAATRAYFEPRFGYDFSRVRVHSDAKAAESARAVNALAYTVGADVVFGAGQYAPSVTGDQRLLAHELTHVLQQSATTAANLTCVGDPDDAYERDADRVAGAIAHTPGKPPATAQVTPMRPASICAVQLVPASQPAKAQKAVPTWGQLPRSAQTDLEGAGYGDWWFSGRPEDQRLTVLNLYSKLKQLGLWGLVLEGSSRTEKGLFEFTATDVERLKRTLRARDDFTDPEESADEWSSREKRARGQLHFKHFSGWPTDKVQAHIDQYGLLPASSLWWLLLPVPLVQMALHGLTYSSYKDVAGIRELWLSQGHDPSLLVGSAPPAPQRKLLRARRSNLAQASREVALPAVGGTPWGRPHALVVPQVPKPTLRRQAPGATPTSVRSPVFEELVTQIVTVEAGIHGRPLTRDELVLARGVFGASIDYGRVRLIPTRVLQWRAVANAIRVPDDFSIAVPLMAESFIHELTHVWQYQHGGTSYVSVSLTTQIAATLKSGSRAAAYDYHPIIPGRTFFDFTPEQQGWLVQNYYAMLQDLPELAADLRAGRVGRYRSNHLTSSGEYICLSAAQRQAEAERELPLHKPLIEQMRKAMPRPEASLLLDRAREVMGAPSGHLAPEQPAGKLAPAKPLIEIGF